MRYYSKKKKKKKKEDKSEASGSNIAMASMPDFQTPRYFQTPNQ